MNKIIIYRAKPNPAGKDKFHNIPLPRQLQGEWVDLANINDQAVTLKGVYLFHTAFGGGCSDSKLAHYWQSPDNLVLGAREILRIHTGKAADAGQMDNVDRQGVHKHAWAEHNSFKLNNGACGEKLVLWWNDTRQTLDQAGYDPYPPEGVVLVREGNKLAVPVAIGRYV
jgi:hypothetical protein